MFARVFALLPLALLAAAQYECQTGSPYCCNQSGYYNTNNPTLTNEVNQYANGNLVGGVAVTAGALVGLTCTGVAGSGAKCSSTPICCTNNSFDGAVVVGCSPVKVLG